MGNDPLNQQVSELSKISNEAMCFYNNATYFEASTSTSLIRILGDEDFIVLH
jgi:hypothetical protein